MEINYKGYRAVLTPSNHMIISKNGTVVSHGHAYEHMTGEEFWETVADIVNVIEGEDIDDNKRAD